jgi:glycosyltransferase involved in cell wall biosynthesis
MSAQPLVSIIIPVYNGNNYVRQAIDSALTQTYRNVEIIVINDGSNDDHATRTIAQSYADKIRYYEKPNGGVASALNLGIANMRGDYFSWLSHDDLYHPDKISVLVDEMTNHPDNIILYSDYELIDEQGDVFLQKRLNHQELMLKPLYALFRGAIHGCSMLIPKIAFETTGVFDESLKTTQDYDLWFKMRQSFHFVHVPQMLIQSRYHAQQDSKKNPLTPQETNALWIKFAEEVSDQEIYQCENSKFLFYHSLYCFLTKHTPYQQAIAHIQQLSLKHKDNILSEIAQHRVSIIIPFHNRIPWTIEAIHSALAQTHRNIQILLINNNSSEDDSAIQQLAKTNENICLLHCSIPGAAAARNIGLQHATGDFIAFLDSDDLWLPEKLTQQLHFMMHNASLMTFSAYQRFIESKDRIISHHKCDGETVSFTSLIRNCPIATPTVLINSLIFNTLKLRFNEELTAGEDMFLWLNIAYYTEITNSRHSAVLVRYHPHSTADNHEIICSTLLKITQLAIEKFGWDTIKPQLKGIIDTCGFHLQASQASHIQPVSNNLFNRVVKNIIHPLIDKTPSRLKRLCARSSLIRKLYLRFRMTPD